RACENDVNCLNAIRSLMTYLPQNCEEKSPKQPSKAPSKAKSDALDSLVPENANKPYDMHEVIAGIMDEDSFFEIHPHYAENIIVGFARLDGRSVGIVANQPLSLAGCLDINA